MQRPEIKEEFDEVIIPWAKAIMFYSKQSCTKTTSIKKIIEATDFKMSCKFLYVNYNTYHCACCIVGIIKG